MTMEVRPLISVIVPVYKVEEYLDRCVNSLLTQTYDNLEIILVDDGSPDNCGQMCDQYANQDSRVRVIHKANGGLSSARNAGIDIAQGEYLGFVDSDDWVVPETYQWMLELALQESVKLVCAGRYDVSSWTGEKTVGLCPQKREVISGEELAKRIFTWDNVDSAAWDKLYHRSLFREARYPDGMINEDLPTTYRIALEAQRIGMLDKPVYCYFHRDGSITTAAFSPKAFQASSHTEKVLAHIRREYPQLEPYASYFHVRQLGYLCQIMELDGKQTMKQYAAEYRSKRNALRSFLPFIMRSSLPTRQQKLTWLTISLGCYSGLRAIYHIGRKEA